VMYWGGRLEEVWCRKFVKQRAVFVGEMNRSGCGVIR